MERTKILLVDDRSANLLALESALAQPDRELVKAGSGAEALRFLLRDECALILMDVNMPDLDGYETARLIRQNERTRDIPIVFITAFGADEGRVALGYESGAIDFLQKPVQPEVLRAKVAGFVALHRAREEIRRQAELLREHERSAHAHALAELEVRALRHREAAARRYRALVDGLSHAVVWVADPVSLACSYASPAAERILGFDADRWVAEPRLWIDRVPEPDRSGVVQAVRSLEAGGPGATIEHRALRADGRTAWLDTALRLVPSEDPAVLELRGLSTDVTEAVEAREAIAFLARVSVELARSLDARDSATRAARAVVGAFADWCAIEWDDDGEGHETVTAHAAPEAEEDARLAAARLALPRLRAIRGVESVAADDAFAPGDPPADAARARLAPSRAVVVPLVARGRRAGTLCLLSRAPLPLGDRERDVAEALGRRVAQAIDNGLLHEATRRAVGAREEFLSIASHELRTPITALHLQTRMLDQLVSDGRIAVPPAARETLERRIAGIARQVERLTALSNSLLDLARMRSDRMTLEPAPCDLGEVLRVVAARFEDALAAERRTLTVDAPEALVGRWDRTRIEQLLTNLVGNAVRHGGSGAIRVTAERRDGAAIVTVADSGPGIPEAEQTRIFEAFAQGRRAARGGAGGLGLGLYIARQIALAHGGRIAVESTPGAGAAFRVTLPLAARADPPAEPASAPVPAAAAGPGELAASPPPA